MRKSLLALTFGVLVLSSCGGSGRDTAGPTTTTSTSTSSTTEPTTTSTTAPPDTTTTTTTTAPPSVPGPPIVLPGTDTPIPSDRVFHRGDDGPEVAAVQQRLTALGFRPGEIDGVYKAQTASAALAFQKFEGIDRDGAVGPDTLAHLMAPTGTGSRGNSDPHIEIDLDRQILFAVDGSATSIINISSGNGRRYSENGVSGVAYTPVGDYTIERRIEGYHKAPLGTLYRPLYFLRGWAIHGSANVPGYPASHGCVRTSNADQDFLWPTFANGTPVFIYSGDPSAPSEHTTPSDAEPGA